MIDLIQYDFPVPSHGTMCGPHASVQEALSKQQVRNIYAQPINDKFVLAIYADDEGNWIMTFINTEGIECLITEGDGWPKLDKGASNE